MNPQEIDFQSFHILHAGIFLQLSSLNPHSRNGHQII
jgi:hypothetical protein